MKKILLTVLFLLSISKYRYGQVNASLNVGGDFDKFYPVTFYDGAWSQSVPSKLILGRSDVHADSLWRGSLMALIDFHVSNYGHGSTFVNATIIPSNTNFVAGWSDGSSNNTCRCLIIWLRGGGTTYHYQSNFAVNPTVYDGIQNSLPYNEVNGPAHTFKTTVEEYATTTGTYQNRNAYFVANVGIGTTTPDERLTVKGKIHTQEVRVDMSGPLVPDYVFAEDYKLKSLQEIEDYIKENKHLPEIPSAKEIEKNGLMLAEMNMNLLKKIEEMTLYMIEMKKEIEKQNEEIQILKTKLSSK
ncbi:hypothetical protein D3C85_1057030 [compost metagenome]